MAMTVTYVDRQKNRKILLPELTSYVLPDSGKLMIREIASSRIYINGDSYEVENRTRDIEIKDYPLEIEVDGSLYRVRVLCGQCREETKFDYNTLRTAFLNNLVQERMDEDILFSAISEELDALKIPLCTFNRKFESITKDYDVVAMEECTNQLPHIFQKPKQHLKQINEIRPAAVVSRIGQESIRHLASHSEHWKGIKASGLVPERLLARTLEDDFAIYENVAVKSIVDQLYKEMKALSEENIDCSMQMDIDDGHAVSGEQKTYFHARDLLLKGMDDESVAYNQMLLEEQREHITSILEKLSKCRSTPLYRMLKRQRPIKGKLKKTNIFMMDKYYKYAYELSELMLNRQEVNPYEAVQDITGEYALFCKILFIFALRYFNFELSNPTEDIFEGETLLNTTYNFEKWHINLTDYNVTSMDINGFCFEMYVDNPIEVNCDPIDINVGIISRFSGVRASENRLVFDRPWKDQEQEELIRELKKTWPKNKTTWPTDFKMKLVAAFHNANMESRRCLMLPWKYVMPDNIEEISQLKSILLDKLKDETFDMIYILTVSRPNEFVNIEDQAVLNSLLTYGKANEETGQSKSCYGIIPIGLGDINSYRRYTKILLDHMIALDHERDVCPICGDKLFAGKGEHNNVFGCHNCGFEIIDTQCSSCKSKFPYTRYIPPKTTAVKIDNPGFRVMARENELGFKNITAVHLEEGTIHPICPYCGK